MTTDIERLVSLAYCYFHLHVSKILADEYFVDAIRDVLRVSAFATDAKD